MAEVQTAYDCGKFEAKAALALLQDVHPTVIDKLHKMVAQLR